MTLPVRKILRIVPPIALSIALSIAICSPRVIAQTDKGSTPSTVGKAGEDCLDARPPGVIAEVGTEQIPTEQIEAMVGPALAKLEKERTQLRHGLVARAIQDHLLEREAAARGVSVEELLTIEVHAHVEEPGEIEVIQRARSLPDRYGPDLESARPTIIADLRREKAVEIGSQFVEGLSQRVRIEWRIDVLVSDPGLEFGDPIAIVEGDAIAFARIAGEWEDQEYDFAMRAYLERRARLDLWINSRLLERAASEAGTDTRTLLAERVDARLVPITDVEVEAFTRANESRIVAPPEEVGEQVRVYLTDLRRRDLELALAEELRDTAVVRIHLEEPAPPIHFVDTRDRPSLGRADAPVTLVKFTDFQCARCREVHGIVEGLPELYRDRVRLVLRNKPLLAVHPLARSAALAAEAARRQGRFFEYVELLYARQETLSEEVLGEIAGELGLELDRFHADRNTVESAARLTEDLEEADRLGIHRTPVLYLNGRRIEDKSVEGILRALHREFRRLGLE